MAERTADRGDRLGPHGVRALVLLSLVAGMVDAVTFLGLDQVFAANMTGNLIVLGLGIGGAPTISIDGPLVALTAFLAGAALLGYLDRGTESRHRRATRLARAEIAVVALAALVAIGFDPDDELRRLTVIAMLAAVMGARNETIRRISVPELPTTVMTLAIAAFAADEGARRSHQRADRRRLAGIAAMLVGAIVSALLVLNTDLVWALAAIVAVEVVVLVALGRETDADRADAATADADTVSG